MGFFDWLFGKKKKNGLGEDDGQAQYFKEEFDPKPAKKVTRNEEQKNEIEESEFTEVKVKKSAKESEPSKSNQKETSAPNNVKNPPKKASRSAKAQKTIPKEATDELVDDSPEIKSADTIKEGRATANGKFDIRKAKDGRYFFSLYASNGLVIAYSQIYSSLSAVNTGMNSVINNMDKAEIEDTTLKKPNVLPCPKWEIYIDKAGEYRFRLYATNGQCVCHSSHGYATKSGCKGGIESIRRFAGEAKVDKSYLK